MATRPPSPADGRAPPRAIGERRHCSNPTSAPCRFLFRGTRLFSPPALPTFFCITGYMNPRSVPRTSDRPRIVARLQPIRAGCSRAPTGRAGAARPARFPPTPTPPRHHPGLGGLRPGRERLGRVGGPGLRPGGLAGRPGAGGPALGGGGVPARAVPAPRAPAPTHPCAETMDARARARSALFSTHARFGRLPAHRVCITTPGVGW